MDDKRDIIAAARAGTKLFLCEGCEEVFSEEELVEIRECSNENCGSVFVATEGRNCTECNRPFTRLATKLGCPTCEDGTEAEEV